MHTGGDKPGDVSDIDHHVSPADVARLAHFLPVPETRIGRGAADNHFRFDLFGLLDELVVVDCFRFGIDLVAVEFVQLAGEINRVAVGQVAAVGKVQPHDFVTRIEDGEINGHVGLGAGMRLDIGVLGIEKLFEAVTGQVLGDIDKFTAAVVSFAGISLGILIGHNAAGRLQDGLGDKVFRGNEFQLGVLAVGFLHHRFIYLGVNLL